MLRLWNCYPSTASLGPDAGKDRLREWLAIVEPFDAETVDRACMAFKRSDSAFPPSVGQIYAECNKHAADAYQRRNDYVPSLARPKQSEAEREDMKRRFNKLVEDLMSGNLKPSMNGFTAQELADENFIVNRVGSDDYTMRPGMPYGYMTRAELAAGRVKPIVRRTEPPSWLERWERENGRSYYGLSEAAE